MKITAENLDQRLEDAGLLMLVRIMVDGAPHKHQLRKTETVTFSTPLVYNTAQEVMSDVDNLPLTTVALIHKFPNRPTQKYVVKLGEVL